MAGTPINTVPSLLCAALLGALCATLLSGRYGISSSSEGSCDNTVWNGSNDDAEHQPIGMGKAVGIIAGSGPEAGIDLASKVLTATRRQFGHHFRGDMDAPRMVMISEPKLGLSMSLQEHEEEVWEALETAVASLPSSVQHYAVACITLHYYSDRLRALEEGWSNTEGGLVGSGEAESTTQRSRPSFVSAVDLVIAAAKAELRAGHRVGLVGSAQTMDIRGASPFKPFVKPAGSLEFVIPSKTDQGVIHALIHSIKTEGPLLQQRIDLTALLEKLDADVVFLACTELPLLLQNGTDVPTVTLGTKRVVDVTALLAEHLAELGRTS